MDSIVLSITMLQKVIDGKTYNAIALEYGVTRTAVERRIKAAAIILSTAVGIEGVKQGAPIFVRRLRTCKLAVAAAIAIYRPLVVKEKREVRLLTDDDIKVAIQRTRSGSACPDRDIALLFLLLTTGARPLEVARLEVRDYLHADGSVRDESIMRSDVAINRKARPLFFASEKSKEAIDSYLAERLFRGFGTSGLADFRGLDPNSRLFLTEEGRPFEIVKYGKPGQLRFLCRRMLDAYHKIFRRIGLPGMSPLFIRRMVAIKMQERGATEQQIGEILGIGRRKSVRELLVQRRHPLRAVVRGLL